MPTDTTSDASSYLRQNLAVSRKLLWAKALQLITRVPASKWTMRSLAVLVDVEQP